MRDEFFAKSIASSYMSRKPRTSDELLRIAPRGVNLMPYAPQAEAVRIQASKAKIPAYR